MGITIPPPDLSGYVLEDDAQLWVPASSFEATSGAPAMGTVGGGRYRAMLYDGAAQETAACAVELPAYVTALEVTLYWTVISGAGNVVWAVTLDRAGNGETIAATGGGGSSGNTTIAAPAADVLKVSTLIASVGADESKLLNLRVSRIGNDAADTLNGIDAALLGVRVRPL